MRFWPLRRRKEGCMTAPRKATGFPVVSDMKDRYVLATDSSGTMSRVASRDIVARAMDVETTYVEDFNEATSPGIRLISGSKNPLNSPPGSWYMGILEVFKRYSVVFQRATSYSDGSMATRVSKSPDVWTDWHVM